MWFRVDKIHTCTDTCTALPYVQNTVDINVQNWAKKHHLLGRLFLGAYYVILSPVARFAVLH